MLRLRVYGDNIVECERGCDLVAASMHATTVRGPYGVPFCPSFELLDAAGSPLAQLQYFPGYGRERWGGDILTRVSSANRPLRESSDVLLTKLEEGREVPLIAIEYCAALPAGNQAWQRSGRALAYSYAGIPYFYITNVGGFELDASRQNIAERRPNPIVPLSYLAHTSSSSHPVLPVYVPSPGCNADTLALHADVFGEQNLLNYLRGLLGLETLAVMKAAELGLEQHVANFVLLLVEQRRSRDLMPPAAWEEVIRRIRAGENYVSDFYSVHSIGWRKRRSIPTTSTFDLLADGVADIASGVATSGVPLCIIAPDRVATFFILLRTIYGARTASRAAAILSLGAGEPLAICWVNGFKPGHDDARPDRGLVPLMRMATGGHVKVMTVVYGPAAPSHWSLLASDPARLVGSNGLWQAVLELSDAVLADSLTFSGDERVFSYSQATPEPRSPSAEIEMPALISPGEQDVDTVLHIAIKALDQNVVFEGLCNPPGGDWSGISLLAANRSHEYRWLTLPRVGAATTGLANKRPDHVLQFFLNQQCIVMSVESKRTFRELERGIGPRLTAYVQVLVESMPNAMRGHATRTLWSQNQSAVERQPFDYVSAVAFIDQGETLSHVRLAANCDLVIAVAIDVTGSATLRMSAFSSSATHILGLFNASRSALRVAGITLVVEE